MPAHSAASVAQDVPAFAARELPPGVGGVELGGVASMWGTLAVCTTGGSPASHRPSHPIFTVPPPLSPLVIRPPRSGGVPAMLEVAQPAFLREAARKGEHVKLIELIEHGANLEATDEVREGSEVVVKSWWWRERGGRSRSPAFR